MKTKSTIGVLFAVLFVVSIYVSGSASTQQDRHSGLRKFQKAYEEILNRYVAEVDAEKLAEAGIRGMLRELDPYSEYIIEENAHRIEALTNGEYGGVGIRLGKIGDTLVVISPMDGTPAFRQGVHAGDIILKIDTVWTRNISLDEAARRVRGPKGSQVELLIRRQGIPEPISFSFERELIKVPDISYSGLIDNRTAYIKIANFSRYTSENLEQAVRNIKQAGMDGLILDLRGNPGGLLNAALRSADLFIPKDALLLSTKGRIKRANNTYYARRKPIISSEIPMVILVDRGSASASEILAGIFQDYDRAVILGEDTYGKGLVQTVYGLDENARLKVTTAKYYLPSGRLIQKRAIAEDILLENVLDTDDADYLSAHDRKFYSGGGITPDLSVEAYNVSDLERNLWRQRLFFTYAIQYVNDNPGMVLPVNVDDSLLVSFKEWIKSGDDVLTTYFDQWVVKSTDVLDSNSLYADNLNIIRDNLHSLSDKIWEEQYNAISQRIRRGLEMEISGALGGNGARIAAGLSSDTVVNEALRLIHDQEEIRAILTAGQDTTVY